MNLTINEPKPADIITIALSGKMLVRIKPDGTVEYGEDYEPDEAARIFWNALALRAPRAFTADELKLIQGWATVTQGEWGRFDDPAERALSDRIDALAEADATE